MRSASPPDGLDAWFRDGRTLDAARRVGIYHHAYYARQCSVLGEVFPRVRALLGDADFSSVARHYVDAFPSRTPVIERIGERFAGFLSQTPPREHPGLADVAHLEWARLEALLSPDAGGTLSLEALAASPPERTRLVLHPAARLLWVSRWSLELFRDAAGAGDPPGDACVLISRPAITVLQREFDDEEGRALARSFAGESLAAVFSEFSGADGVERAGRALALFLRLGAWAGLEVRAC